MKQHSKLLSGLAAIAIYFGIIGLVFYYFGYRSHLPPKHFVSKNSQSIAVSLSAPTKHTKAHGNISPKPKPIPKPVTKKPSHTKPKPIVAKKPAPVTPKPKAKPAKKIRAKSLFAHVKTSSKPKPKVKKSITKPTQKTSKASAKKSRISRDALKRQQTHDRGIENRYLAKVQNALYGWPSQSNFAGARITISLTIYPDGHFDYRVLTPSSNSEFDRTIRQYLNQLKKVGFDATPKGKKYAFKVEIVAK